MSLYQEDAIARAAMDVTALTIVVGSLVDYLPAVSAAISIVWGLLRIYETKTVQDLLDRWRKK